MAVFDLPLRAAWQRRFQEHVPSDVTRFQPFVAKGGHRGAREERTTVKDHESRTYIISKGDFLVPVIL